MSRRILRCALAPSAVLAAAVILLNVSTPTRAETKAERAQAAAALVKEALHREVYGLGGDREQLLTAALEKNPDLAAARWHLGQVNVKGKWFDYEEAAAQAQANPRLAEYRRLRDQANDTVEGQLALADWCLKNKLPEQERAHLTRVIELSPEHQDARRRLGHLRVNGQWLSAEERRDDYEQAVQQRKDLGKWRPVMQEIASGLARRGQKQREAAQQRLLAIDDPAAIGAMEEVVSPVSEEAARLVIEALARMPQHEASVALARQAVYSPHASVRTLACEKLRARPRESYVPELLGSLQTPVVSRSQIFRGRGGSLVCRQVVTREGQDHRDVTVLETEYNRVPLPTGSRDESLARALADLRRTQNVRDAALSRENEETMLLNLRLMQTLEAATGQTLPPDPQEWWDWWNQENEVFVQTDKELRQTVHRDQVTIVDRPTIPTGTQTTGGEGRQSVQTPRLTVTRALTCDCLAAGTKVWTDQGAMAIEDIRVGDRVLAQHPQTGELMYKPVLGTTIRPASQLVRIEAGQDSVTTSGGHLYWVAGDGWRKARELNSGDEIHSVRGSVRISRVEKAEFAPTYNLIVADFSTYFVGHGLLMCHDNTLRQPTNAVVPGLSH